MRGPRFSEIHFAQYTIRTNGILDNNRRVDSTAAEWLHVLTVHLRSMTSKTSENIVSLRDRLGSIMSVCVHQQARTLCGTAEIWHSSSSGTVGAAQLGTSRLCHMYTLLEKNGFRGCRERNELRKSMRGLAEGSRV